MQQSNTYILIFTGVMTLILGGVLSFTSVVLKPLQVEQEEIATKKKILGAVTDISDIKKDPEAVAKLYARSVESLVINAKGEPQTKDSEGNLLSAERINVQKNHKIEAHQRFFPIFLYKESPNSPKPDAYVFPMFGAGLWDWISGYIALGSDLNTVRGIAFDHKTETPGLGARIASTEVQKRYRDKQIFDPSGRLISITMLKGEKGKPLDSHHVDGMSGATMTGNGVNSMLKEYLIYYLPYIERIRKGTEDTIEDHRQ